MKFLLLAYGAEDAWTEEERAACTEQSLALCHELAAEGKYLAASPLAPVATARCIRVRSGGKLITDGPFAEAAEHLGGYFLIDVANIDEAVAFASRLPVASKGGIEVRPVTELRGLPHARS